MKHMPGYEEWKIAVPQRKIAIARENVKTNPHVTAYHFHTRFKAFKEQVLKPKFNIVDDWSRYEWQSRGSTHSHGTYWCDGAPSPEVGKATTATLQAFARFWGVHITAINPQPSQDRQVQYEESPLCLQPVQQANTL